MLAGRKQPTTLHINHSLKSLIPHSGDTIELLELEFLIILNWLHFKLLQIYYIYDQNMKQGKHLRVKLF